jgi:ribosomal protein S18 acetylase RimI-like enzyme
MIKICERPYQTTDDLFRIGSLIRQAYAQSPAWNTWSFARFDIWAQRRIADERALGHTDWHRNIALWETANGDLAGAVLIDPREGASLIGTPDQHDLIEPMIEWAEAYRQAHWPADRPFIIEAMESNMLMQEHLCSRGYTRLAEHMLFQAKSLDAAYPEPVMLSPGFTIQVLGSPHGWPQYFDAVHAVFKFMDSVEAFAYVMQAPSAVHDLHLNVMSEQGELAAFCSVWIDRQNHLAEFEPVGTLPAFQKRGLASALLADASNRLRAMGCPQVTVFSWSESVGANKLYEAAGLQVQDRVRNWQRDARYR